MRLTKGQLDSLIHVQAGALIQAAIVVASQRLYADNLRINNKLAKIS